MKDKVIVQCGIELNNEYWFVAGNTNGLFKKNLLTNQIDFVGFFPKESKIGFRLYSSLAFIDNKLIFAPCHAKTIAIYHINERRFSNIPIDDENNSYNRYLKLVQYRGCIYFIPFWAASFIKYNVYQESLVILDDWTEICNKYAEPNVHNFIIEGICTDNNYIYMFTSCKNQVIILDMDTDQFQIKSLDISLDECIHSICKQDNSIWIVTNKNRIFKWNYVDNELVLIIDFIQYIKYHIYYIFVNSRYVYVLSIYEKNIGIYDYINDEFVIMTMSHYVGDKKDDCVSLYYYYDLQSIGDKIYLFSFYDGKYMLIDADRVTDVFGRFFLPEEYWQHDFSDEIVSESTLMYLGMSYAEWAGHTLRENDAVYSRENNIGGKIYECSCKE